MALDNNFVNRLKRNVYNVAEMISTPLVVDSYVCTSNYYVAGDGGGGDYIISATSSGIYETLNNGLYANLIYGLDLQ